MAEGRIGPTISDMPKGTTCKYQLHLDMKIREMPNYSTCLGRCSLPLTPKQPTESQVVELKPTKQCEIVQETPWSLAFNAVFISGIYESRPLSVISLSKHQYYTSKMKTCTYPREHCEHHQALQYHTMRAVSAEINICQCSTIKT